MAPFPGHFGFELLELALAVPAGSERRIPIPEVSLGAGVTT